MNTATLLRTFAIVVLSCLSLTTYAQCKEELNAASREKIHYHQIPLDGKHEFLRFVSTGEERIFSYYNEKLDLVYHVQMFTEVKFSSSRGNFSLFTTTSDRTRWQTDFTLSAPLSAKELTKMRGATKMEILLPEEKRVFVFDLTKNKAINEALTCIH